MACIGLRAQVTLFIIIAITLLLVFGVVFSLSKGMKKPPSSKPELYRLEDLVANCVKSAGETALYLLGSQGGYTDTPLKHVETNYTAVGYAFYQGKGVFVSKREMENQLSSYVEKAIPLCVNFSMFPTLNITAGEIESNVSVLPESVIINVKYPIIARKADTIYRLSGLYTERFNVRLGLIHDTVKRIVQNQINNKYLDLSFLLNQKMPTYILNKGVNNQGKEYVYAIHDTQSVLKNQTYMFLFAFRY